MVLFSCGGDVVGKVKRKMTKHEIKAFISIKILYFVIMILIRNFVFSVIMGIISLNNFAHILIDTVITFVIIEFVFQIIIYKYAYYNAKNIKKFWWLEILRVALIPLLLYFIIGMWYFNYSGKFLFSKDIETVYLILALWIKDLLNPNTTIYILSFIIINSIRLLISELVTYYAIKKRKQHRGNLISGG